MIVFGLAIHVYRKRKRRQHDQKKKLGFSWIVFWFFHAGDKLQVGQFHVSPVTSTPPVSGLSSHRRLALNDGVPVEVVLDVVRRQHAPHLEVSQRQPVLLLAQRAQVSYGWRKTSQ